MSICHRLDYVVGKRRWVRRGKAHTLKALNLPAGTKQLCERSFVSKFNAVGVHVLTEQSYFDDALSYESSNFCEHVFWGTIAFLSTKRRNDAECAGVITADRNANHSRICRVALGRQAARESFQCFHDFDLRFVVVPCSFEEGWQGTNVVGSEDYVDPRCLRQDYVAILLCQATTDRYLQVRFLFLLFAENAEVAVKLVIRIFANRTGIEDHYVSNVSFGRHVTGSLEHAGKSLGIMHIHLAAVCAHLVGTY